MRACPSVYFLPHAARTKSDIVASVKETERKEQTAIIYSESKGEIFKRFYFK